MIKKFLTPICITLAIGVLYTPISVNAQPLNKATAYTIQQPQTLIYNKIKFDTLSYDKAPEALTKDLDLYKANKGFVYYVDKNSGNLYVAIMAGEKPTTGYGIKVNSVEDVEGQANILIEETTPNKDALLPQLITYPYTIIKAQLPAYSISVKNSSGEVYNYLSSKADSDILGASCTSGILKNIYTENNFIFLELQDTNEDSQLFYVENTTEWKTKTKNLKLDSNVSIRFTLGTPRKYKEKSAFPLSEVNLPVDKNSLTDKNWENLKTHSSISPDKQWTISFKQPLKEEDVNSSTIYVADSTGNIVPTAVSLSKDSKSVKVTPYKSYKLGENYYLFITKNLNNTDSLLNGFRMNFQISDSVPIK